MEENTTRRHSTIAPLFYFVASAAAAAILLLAAIVAGITEIVGSTTWATLIVGGFFLFIAWLTYVLAVRRVIDDIRDRLDTIYDVANAARNAYRMAMHLTRNVLDEIMRK